MKSVPLSKTQPKTSKYRKKAQYHCQHPDCSVEGGRKVFSLYIIKGHPFMCKQCKDRLENTDKPKKQQKKKNQNKKE